MTLARYASPVTTSPDVTGWNVTDLSYHGSSVGITISYRQIMIWVMSRLLTADAWREEEVSTVARERIPGCVL